MIVETLHLLVRTVRVMRATPFETPKASFNGGVRLEHQHLQYLAQPMVNRPSVHREGEHQTWILGELHDVHARYPEAYAWVDSVSREPFEHVVHSNGLTNSAIARLPFGSPYDAMIVGRGWSGKYDDKESGQSLVNMTIVGFFANFDLMTGSWERVGADPYILDLPVYHQVPAPCGAGRNGGSADPRIFWSDAGEPLGLFGVASRVQGTCKAVAMIDLRAAWPGLKELLTSIGRSNVPITFDRLIELGRNDKKNFFEKNWAAFFPGVGPGRDDSTSSTSVWPHFAAQVFPRTIVQVNPDLDTSERSSHDYALAEPIDLYVEMPVDAITTSSEPEKVHANNDCLRESFSLIENILSFHQATPFHRITLCKRGTCAPTMENTVLIGLIHIKKGLSYRRFFTTLSPEAPFQVISVSPLYHFVKAELDNHVVFCLSLAFFPSRPTAVPETENEAAGKSPEATDDPELARAFTDSDEPAGYLSHGWLDDELVIGVGLRDSTYSSIHMPLTDILKGHKICNFV